MQTYLWNHHHNQDSERTLYILQSFLLPLLFAKIYAMFILPPDVFQAYIRKAHGGTPKYIPKIYEQKYSSKHYIQKGPPEKMQVLFDYKFYKIMQNYVPMKIMVYERQWIIFKCI